MDRKIKTAFILIAPAVLSVVGILTYGIFVFLKLVAQEIGTPLVILGVVTFISFVTGMCLLSNDDDFGPK